MHAAYISAWQHSADEALMRRIFLVNIAKMVSEPVTDNTPTLHESFVSENEIMCKSLKNVDER